MIFLSAISGIFCHWTSKHPVLVHVVSCGCVVARPFLALVVSSLVLSHCPSCACCLNSCSVSHCPSYHFVRNQRSVLPALNRFFLSSFPVGGGAWSRVRSATPCISCVEGPAVTVPCHLASLSHDCGVFLMPSLTTPGPVWEQAAADCQPAALSCFCGLCGPSR